MRVFSHSAIGGQEVQAGAGHNQPREAQAPGRPRIHSTGPGSPRDRAGGGGPRQGRSGGDADAAVAAVRQLQAVSPHREHERGPRRARRPALHPLPHRARRLQPTAARRAAAGHPRGDFSPSAPSLYLLISCLVCWCHAHMPCSCTRLSACLARCKSHDLLRLAAGCTSHGRSRSPAVRSCAGGILWAASLGAPGLA